tara:strand:- start:4679 stop:4912 length:234 start_codon:yes stop_codon:yes gene_type:complete
MKGRDPIPTGALVDAFPSKPEAGGGGGIAAVAFWSGRTGPETVLPAERGAGGRTKASLSTGRGEMVKRRGAGLEKVR